MHIYFLSLTKGTIDNIRLRFYFKGHAMPISAKNQLEVEITEGKNRCGKFLIVAKEKGGESLKTTATTDSEASLSLKAVFLFKASSIVVAKGDSELKLSATNQIKGKISSLKEGAVNAEVDIDIAGGDKLSAIIANESVKI